MTWDEYATQKADELAECRFEAHANAIIDEILLEFKRSNASSDLQRRFWQRLAEEYARAPKPLLKESIAAQSLNSLIAAVQQFLQQKASGK